MIAIVKMAIFGNLGLLIANFVAKWACCHTFAAHHQVLKAFMISRRNIRIKVMQSLYALHNADQDIVPGQAEKILKKHFDDTISLFVFLIYHIAEVARFAETDARTKASKHLPSVADLNVPVKIAGNELLWRILESNLYTEGVARFKPALQAEVAWIRKLYQHLANSSLYQMYSQSPQRDKKAEKEILEYIFTDLMLADDDFTQYVEDIYNNWDDDAEMLRLLIMHFLQKPGIFKFNEMLSREKFDFALQLLETVKERENQLDELIKPKLRNWDPDRLAQLDTIILQMGVCEFLYFETIPLKVTINEYIDLAKEYSTQQSGQFVNGILDNIRIELENNNRVHKVAFKK